MPLHPQAQAVCDLTNVDCVFFCDVPNPIPDMAAKLDAILRRGGTVVFGLGPNAAASRERYNTVFYRDGAGVLPGALGDVVAVTGPDDPGFRLVARCRRFPGRCAHHIQRGLRRRCPLAPCRPQDGAAFPREIFLRAIAGRRHHLRARLDR